jgi:hypothetical protein
MSTSNFSIPLTAQDDLYLRAANIPDVGIKLSEHFSSMAQGIRSSMFDIALQDRLGSNLPLVGTRNDIINAYFQKVGLNVTQ